MYTSIQELKNDFQIRPARMEDAGIVADLFNLCSQEIIGKNDFESGELTAGWKASNIDLEKDTLTVFDGENLIGYADIWGFLPPFVRVNTWARVHPNYKNRGIGWALNKWAESRSIELTQKAEKDLQTFTVSYINVEEKESIQLLTDLGAKPVRYSWVMEADIPESLVTMNATTNFTIRPISPDEYFNIYLLKEETFNDHWGHIDTTEEEGWKEFQSEHLQDPNYDPELWFAAEINGVLAGFIFGNKSTPFGDDYGWVSILGVKREYRKSGIGKALLLHFFQAIKDKGSKRVGLSVDTDSLTGASKLYESVGLRVIEKYVRLEKVLREGLDIRVRNLS